MNRRLLSVCLFLVAASGARAADPGAGSRGAQAEAAGDRPNILVLVADAWPWPHDDGAGVAQPTTRAFDSLVAGGVHFERAFACAASTQLSRLTLATGQYPWQLAQAGAGAGSEAGEPQTYVEGLAEAGYHSGYCGEGLEGGGHLGDRFDSLEAFLAARQAEQPFSLWFSLELEKPSEGESTGPGRDPLQEAVHRMDREIGEVLERLEQSGELDETVIVLTATGGVRLPGDKASLGDRGLRVPLVMHWGGEWQAPRKVRDLVSLCDLAPTLLELAGLPLPLEMAGGSLAGILGSRDQGRIEPARGQVLAGRRAQPGAGAARAIRTEDFLYVRSSPPPALNGGDAGLRAGEPLPRQAEELYDLGQDPLQQHNLSGERSYGRGRARMRALLDAQLIGTMDPALPVEEHRTHRIQGWRVLVHRELWKTRQVLIRRALALLEQQLVEVVQRVPAQALPHLRRVPIWINRPYAGVEAGAEYHPGRAWLASHGRLTQMAKGIEITCVDELEAEVLRMPLLVLHELSHAYHDQVLGFEDPAIQACFERARDSGSYDEVPVFRGTPGESYGRAKAYAMSDPMEYFAELSEAYFGRNDWFPFHSIELAMHDPAAVAVLEQAWGGPPARRHLEVSAPPAALGAPSFYTKYLSAYGLPVLSSAKVNDYALREAGFLITEMLALRPDVLQAMIDSGSQLRIMGHGEWTTDLPGWDHMRPRDFWDARARGMGGSRTDPLCSCAEENVLGFPGDPYATESIVIHELAHNIHLRGVVNVDESFDGRLKACYERAMEQGLWAGKYASVNRNEYFAEGVQSWFDNNRPPDHDHNHVDTRVELVEYDPGLAALCREVFGETELTYTKPATRLHGHLEGYDPSGAPTFRWPERLREAKAEIQRNARERSEKGSKKDGR